MKIRHPKDKRLKRKELEEINEWLEAKIGFLKLEIDELEEKYVEIKKAAVAINLAIKIDSEKPKRHKKTMLSHRSEWPYLWKRIDELIEIVDNHYEFGSYGLIGNNSNSCDKKEIQK